MKSPCTPPLNLSFQDEEGKFVELKRLSLNQSVPHRAEDQRTEVQKLVWKSANAWLDI